MHEIALVQGLLEQLHALAKEHQKRKIITVSMEIGPFSGVVVDSFQFGFDILSKDAPLTKDAELIIHSPAALYRCCGCGRQIQEQQRPKSCPQCSQTLFSPEGSVELMLLQVEME